MTIHQSQIDALIKRVKDYGKKYTSQREWGESSTITVSTSSGQRSPRAWLFAGRKAGLTEYFNIVGYVNIERRWIHLKTVDDFERLENPEDAFGLIQLAIDTMMPN